MPDTLAESGLGRFAQDVAHCYANGGTVHHGAGNLGRADGVLTATRCGAYIVCRRPGLGGATVWFVGINPKTGEQLAEVVGP